MADKVEEQIKIHNIHRIEYHLIPIILNLCKIALWFAILIGNYYAEVHFTSAGNTAEIDYLSLDIEFW